MISRGPRARGDTRAIFNLQESVFRSNGFVTSVRVGDGGGGVKSNRHVKGLPYPFDREQVILPEIRHVCDAFQRQLARRALEGTDPLVHHEIQTSIYGYRKKQSAGTQSSSPV